MNENQKTKKPEKRGETTILISAYQEDIQVILKKESKKIDQISLKDNKDLSFSLLTAIDKILKRNKINYRKISKIEAKTTKTRLTSARIIKTVVKTGNYCLTKIRN